VCTLKHPIRGNRYEAVHQMDVYYINDGGKMIDMKWGTNQIKQEWSQMRTQTYSRLLPSCTTYMGASYDAAPRPVTCATCTTWTPYILLLVATLDFSLKPPAWVFFRTLRHSRRHLLVQPYPLYWDGQRRRPNTEGETFLIWNIQGASILNICALYLCHHYMF
jgi:hypothetical protein